MRELTHTSNPAFANILPSSPAGSALARWKFDSGDGVLALDSSGNGRHAVLGPTTAWSAPAPQGGFAASLLGLPDSLLALPEASAAFPRPHVETRMGWVRTKRGGPVFTFAAPAGDGVVSQQEGVAAIDEDVMSVLRVAEDGHVEVAESGNRAPAPAEARVRSEGTVNDGRWHHVAFTRNEVGVVVIYIDGLESGRGSVPTDVELGGVADISHRRRLTVPLLANVGPAAVFDGSIDDVQVYNDVLTLREMRERCGPRCLEGELQLVTGKNELQLRGGRGGSRGLVPATRHVTCIFQSDRATCAYTSPATSPAVRKRQTLCTPHCACLHARR